MNISRPSRRLPAARQYAILAPMGWTPMVMVLAGVLVLAACFSGMGFALLKVLPPALPQETLRPVLPPVVHQEPDPRAEMAAQKAELAVLDKELRDAHQRVQDLDREAQPVPGRILALNRQQDQLAHQIDQRRTSLRESEDAARRQAAQQEAARQEAARQRVEGLRAEAAELERRIAALKAGVGQAQEARRVGAELERRSPQIVECSRDVLILEPQNTRIPVAALRGGAFVTAVTGRGVLFLVRPDGIDSFLAARAVAREAGVPIGYEPVLSGSKP
jgi:small-conductance mechanosensitive channel